MTVIEFPTPPRQLETIGRFRFDPLGLGGVDRPSQLGCSTVRGIDVGASADRTDSSEAAVRYANKRAEMGAT